MKPPRLTAAAALLAALALSGRTAVAAPPMFEPPATEGPAKGEVAIVKARPEIAVEITPLFGASAPLAAGWTGFVVRVQNSGDKPVRGEIAVESHQYSDSSRFRATAPFTVGARSSVNVQLPTHAGMYGETSVMVRDDVGQELGSHHASMTAQQALFLLDVTEISAIRGPLHEMPVAPTYMPWGLPSYGAGPQILVGSPRFDPATGDPILPDRAALYAPVTAVLIRSDLLVRLGAAELDALSGFVLAGGSLAISLARPEDIRHPTLTAFAGGPIRQTSVHSETLKPLHLSAPSSSTSTKSIPYATEPSEEIGKALVGFAGGNLSGSAYGASAFYGLGEVHLLAFDATRRPAVDDPWAQARMVDLTRTAFDRRSSIVYRQGSAANGAPTDNVRKQLDPNEGSRWSIAVAAVLLCVYAVLAGPLNFTMNTNRGKPLRALLWLQLLAAVTFLVIVGIGVAAKGTRGRSRHLTLVEAGAGMNRGTARRWRGLYSPRAKELTVRTTDSSSVVLTASVAAPAERNDHMIVDRDGARLVDVAALPWQTVVIREDGFASLGEGISIVHEGEQDVAVVNRSGRDLRAAVLMLPGLKDARYFKAIKDGERVLASAGKDLSATADGSRWLVHVATVSSGRGGIDLHPLDWMNFLTLIDQKDAPGLGEAWGAVETSAGSSASWFPDKVPVLLGQLDGGEGRASDAGLKMESDRLLVRVVGFGGRP
jgi:hypothetical protein